VFYLKYKSVTPRRLAYITSRSYRPKSVCVSAYESLYSLQQINYTSFGQISILLMRKPKS